VSATTKHALLQSELARRLGNHALAHNLGYALTEQRVILSRVARVPDVSFYRHERLPLDDTGQYVDHPTTPPDLVVEIYSPGQEDRRELVVKAAWYVEQGVRVVLLVDPDRRRVTSFTPNGEAIFETNQPLPLSEILPGLQLTPAELFAALEP
jgi:Uma2 family endonuclease